MESITEKLVSGIPDKIKFIIGPSLMSGPKQAPETLELVTASTEELPLQLLKILNKRWQTLDLISMLKELKRTTVITYHYRMKQILDGLSSLPRFKKK